MNIDADPDQAAYWRPESNVRQSRLIGSLFLIFAGLGSLGILVFLFTR